MRLWPVTVGLLLIPCVALADEPSAADLASARTLGIEGIKLAEEGKCKDAVDRLARAEKIRHAPTTGGRLGECQIQLGQLVEGLENLRRVLRDNTSGNEVFQRAQDRAKEVFDKNVDRPAKLKITVNPQPSPEGLAVLDNGQPVSLAVLSAQRLTDPGEHVIEATAPGFKKAQQTVKLSERGSDAVTLTLEVDPSYVKPEPTVPGARTEERRNYTPAIVAGGIGLVGFGLGAIFGGIALGTKNDLDAACTNKMCPPTSRKTYDSANTQAAVSTAGFIFGALGLGTAVVLALVAPKQTITVGASVRPVVGLGSLGVEGNF